MSELKSILYVEDDPDIQAIGKLALESIGGFEITACDGGKAALAALDSGKRFQLVLLDVMMPGMDGPSTLQAMRKTPAGKDLPVIFCTAKVQKSEKDSYLALGAIGVVSKPFDAMAISSEIRKLWEQSGK